MTKQEEWNKRFYERFVKKPVDWRENHGWTVPYVDSRADKLLDFLQSEIDLAVAEVVVDIYEVRAQTITPYQKTTQEKKVENLLQYNFLNSLIAKLCDKYKIPNEMLKEIFSRRYLKEKLGKPFNPIQ